MISCLPDMTSGVASATTLAAAARFFRVLGDPTRLLILEMLSDGPRTVGELTEAAEQSQPRVSTHLACLRYCGFVERRRRGKEVVYSLAVESLEGLMNRASSTMAPIATRLETCGRIGPDWV